MHLYASESLHSSGAEIFSIVKSCLIDYQVRHAIRMFFLVVFPLFILAALIETVLISLMGGGVPR